MDHRELLKKYIEFVVMLRGTSFISPMLEYHGFEDDEVEELRRLDAELDEEAVGPETHAKMLAARRTQQGTL